MTIHIPKEVLIAGGVLFCAALAMYAMKQTPEMLRYMRTEGM